MSIAKVANPGPSAPHPGLGKRPALIDRWSSRHRWVRRIGDWDAAQARNGWRPR
ncbi:hypothetical protein [Thermomonospora umbrina]|uniref:hypothetical protein n=1 Tax=Thermomonospora umbrina TaxID=111806 RepID=UPI0014772537|nr:hypothetical protein [Thermomonospora umbrina]